MGKGTRGTGDRTEDRDGTGDKMRNRIEDRRNRRHSRWQEEQEAGDGQHAGQETGGTGATGDRRVDSEAGQEVG